VAVGSAMCPTPGPFFGAPGAKSQEQLAERVPRANGGDAGGKGVPLG
jgi:hypothetical protein